MTIVVDVQYADEKLSENNPDIPSRLEFEKWVNAVLSGRCKAGELAVRVVGVAESAILNDTYRHRSGPTNVLAFPADCPSGVELPLLGDVVICAPVVFQEALEQRKLPVTHWAHLTVHGTLHLLGYKHEVPHEAEVMEGLEAEILAGFGYPDPYADEEKALTAS